MSSLLSTKASSSIIILLIAIISKVFLHNASLYKPEGLCTETMTNNNKNDDKTTISIDTRSGLGTITPSPCESFSETYYEAKSKFKRAAKLANAELISLDVLPNQQTQGLYTMDIAILRGTSTSKNNGGGLVIHTSGVHGVEGYAGSAIQIAMLTHIGTPQPQAQTQATTKHPPTIIFVHAVNPYGMAHNRRFNEHNVDLNRNALHPPEWKEMLGRDKNIANYDDFDRSFLNPPHAPHWFMDAYVKVWMKSLYAILRYGFVNMKRAMVAGQYHNPRGIFYGGNQLEPSHRLLWDFLEGFGIDDYGGSVTWVDVHTGLGPSGVDTLLLDPKSDYEKEEKWFPDAPMQGFDSSSSSSNSNSDVSEGYELTRGLVNQFYEKLSTTESEHTSSSLPNNTLPPLILTQEFGTVPGVLVARAMILENMAFHYAPQDQPRWAEYTRDAFYVRTEDWRRSVLTRGLIVFDQAISRSSS